ncbi:N-formylglutamate amidohydrolase [Denitrobaculum tricleocarpae]|uniref:N-formylglutamate amidohydrolase n=1 Tax=Denitrobaculum tricleocarpae TaxID=2591009 RepID=A0A545TWQ9_9PROT|nr:N-formylglutamate amidohydrolase [Denitrobaculum tricleocarpae]
MVRRTRSDTFLPRSDDLNVARRHRILAPKTQTLPLVFSSPHSGCDYPTDFIAKSRLDPTTLRRSEDSFVDELFSAAPECGAPLVAADFPRAYVDVNREPYELDPAMFDEALPAFVNTHSPRIAAGLGTIARVVASGVDIYRGKLTFAEVEQRIQQCYYPYHAALRYLIEQTLARFGYCIMIDCHSMPSLSTLTGGPGNANRIDFVLGDHHGESCDPAITGAAAALLRSCGYQVGLNKPYAGGFITTHYGRPADGVHVLQIEISRDIYMDEASLQRGPGLKRLAAEIRILIQRLGALDPGSLTPVLAAE